MKTLLIDWLYLIPTGTAVGLLVRLLTSDPSTEPTGSYLLTVLVIWAFVSTLMFLRQPRLQKLTESWERADPYSTSISIGMFETVLFLITIMPLTYLISSWVWSLL